MVPYIGSKFLVFFLLFEMVECMIQFHHKQEICRKLLIIVFSLLVVLVLFFLIPGEFSPPLFGLNLKWTLTLLYKLKSSTWYAKDLFPWILYTQKTTEPSEGLKIRGCQYYLMGIICPPPVEIGLTDLPKSGAAMATPTPPGTTPLDKALLLTHCRHARNLFDSKIKIIF